MSLLTKGIGIVKKIKHKYDARIKEKTPVYLSPVRRIERIKTTERVVAMTFDDGPSAMPPSPQGVHTAGLTAVLVETLEKYGAKGTFDVIGSTKGSYPDAAGKHGSASWGGKRFDHYPDIHRDDLGGVTACPDIVRRILRGGHEITSHTYSHVLFGRKPLVYGQRSYLGDIDRVLEDLRRLHDLMKDEHGYEMTLSRPPHYVDRISKGLSSYDAYAVMGYQYLAASFDGGGWLPLATYEAEVEAMWKPVQAMLEKDPDYFCGQIIFQKDGFNMARRTPVADGLEKQLKLLTEAGYRVVTVSELMRESPFADLGRGDRYFEEALALDRRGYCTAYRDNTVRPLGIMTRGELCMTIFGKVTVNARVEQMKAGKKRICSDVNVDHPYAQAIEMALRENHMTPKGSSFHPDHPLTWAELRSFMKSCFGLELPEERSTGSGEPCCAEGSDSSSTVSPGSSLDASASSTVSTSSGAYSHEERTQSLTRGEVFEILARAAETEGARSPQTCDPTRAV